MDEKSRAKGNGSEQQRDQNRVAPPEGRTDWLKGEIRRGSSDGTLVQDRVYFRQRGAGRDAVVGFAAAVAGQRNEFQMIPAIALAHRTGLQHRSLDAVDRHDHVGQREQSAPPTESRLTAVHPVEAEAIVPDKGADDAADQPDGNHREDRGQGAAKTHPGTKTIDGFRFRQGVEPAARIEKVVREQKIQILGNGSQDRE